MPEIQDNSEQIYKKLKRFFLEREIANFYEYLSILDKELNLRQQDLLAKIDGTNNNFKDFDENDERRSELVNLKVESEQIKGFTNLLRQSFITSLYSFMELWLTREWHLDSKRRDNGLSYKSARRKGLEETKRYFVSVMRSNYPFGSSQDWLWITNFELLRNCIVHRQGSLTGFSDLDVSSTLATFVQNEQGLSLFGTDNQQVFIEFEFCLKALKTVHRFMIEVLALETKTG